MPLDTVDPRREALSWEDIATIIDNELSQSDHVYHTGGNTARIEAMDYYMRRKPVQSVRGRSTMISPDVSTMVDHTLAQIMDSFSQFELIRVLPESEEDRPQAQLETYYLNWKFFQECNGWTVMHNAFKDALLFRNGITTIDVDDIVESEYMEYEDLTQAEMDAFLDTDVIIEDYELTRGGKPLSEDLSPEEMPELDDIRYNITVRVDYPRRKIKIREVAPEDFGVNVDHTSVFVKDARFVWERIYPSEEQLLEMGISKDVVDQLPSYSFDTTTEEKTGRRENWSPTEPVQKTTRIIVCYYCYLRLDMDGSGEARPYRVLFSNRRVLELKLFDLIPYAVACPFPIPHAFYGESMHDKIKQVQDGKTQLLRIVFDNAANLTYGRIGAVEGMVNIEDLKHPKPSGIVRMARPDALVPIDTKGLATLPADVLAYYDKMRRESGGSALDMSTENIPVNLETAHGAERMISSMEQFVALIAQAFANTYVTELFKLLHHTLRRYQPGLASAMVDQQSYTTDPGQWRRREHLAVTIGMSKGERQAQVAGLMAMHQAQMQLHQQGGDGVLVSYEKMYNTLYDLGRSIGMKRPSDYWVDPKSPEAQQAMRAKQEMAQQQAQAQQEQMQAQQQFAQEQLGVMKYSEDTKRIKVEYDYEVDKLKATADAFHKQDKIANELTELELEHDTNLPGAVTENETD